MTGELGPLGRALAAYEARHPAIRLKSTATPKRSQAPTEKQLRVLATLRAFVRANGFGPTVRELAQVLGLAPSTIVGHLYRLEHLGAIELTGRARAIRVLVGADRGEANVRTPVAARPRADGRTRTAKPRLRVVGPPVEAPAAGLGVDDFDRCNGVD